MLAVLLAFGLMPFVAFADDQGEAYAKCLKEVAKASGERITDRQCLPESVSGGGQLGGIYRAYYRLRNSSGGVSGLIQYGPDFPWMKACSARPEELGWKGGGDNGLGSVCSSGCTYEGSLYAQSPTGRLFTPTGEACSTNDHPEPTNPDPGEGGGDGGGTGPGDGGGDGGGTDPGGGDGGGTGGGDGGGGTGPGDGDGGGTDPGGGTGPGPGPGTGEGGEGGGAGPTTGRLYKKSGKTVAKVLADFKAGIEGAPILSKVKGFFGTCTGGGSCPTASWDGGQYAGKFDLASLCSGPLLQLFQYAGFVFLAGMGVVALRWALL
ncbi:MULTISPECIES: hypothetical protein [Stenotrophomonas]|uniref:hypothetical protein n=1 Tax=Stenotrophomonas TaxID=40323 RepID=UPI0015DF3CB4|nr:MULTISPECIES: hypothetical protein [Stenotrophomonas]MDH0274186.1 hypothetical protein [Stenotrophomonas sp. GD04089]MDH1910667.1 hypothetical protein [Stenotrophomonas sp. GD03794]